MSIFGTSEYNQPASSSTVQIDVRESSNSIAAFFDGGFMPNSIGFTKVHDDYDYTATFQSGYQAVYNAGGKIQMSGDWAPNTARKYSYVGTALVLNTNVPEPSTIAIFALGLMGLGLRRRNRA